MSKGKFLEDLYIPKSIDDMHFHSDTLLKLANMSKDDNIPNLILYGPEGSGKKTIINMFLEMIYDSSVRNIKEDIITVSKPSAPEKTKKSGTISKSKAIQVIVPHSNYHIVIELAKNASDKYMIQGVIKKYSVHKPMEIYNIKRVFKTIVIPNADELPEQTQKFLRRTMEKYSKTCRYILCCKRLSGLIKPIQSRCYIMAIPRPQNMEIKNFVKFLSKSEKIEISKDKIKEIVKKADGNIKKSIQLLEFHQHGITDTKNSYEQLVEEIVNILLQAKIENITKVKDMLYHMMITNFTCAKILSDVILALIEKIKDNSVKEKIMFRTSIDISNLTSCRRHINHLMSCMIYITAILMDTK